MGIFVVSDAFAARDLWLPSACPGRSADLCRATMCLVERWGCCRGARTLRCARRTALALLGWFLIQILGFVLHSTLLRGTGSIDLATLTILFRCILGRCGGCLSALPWLLLSPRRIGFGGLWVRNWWGAIVGLPRSR